jgi:hypothetical protein
MRIYENYFFNDVSQIKKFKLHEHNQESLEPHPMIKGKDNWIF